MNLSLLHWLEAGLERQALWPSDSGTRQPSRVETFRTLDADTAYRLASAGTGLLWRGDFPEAQQLLQKMSQRMTAIAQRQKKAGRTHAPVHAAEAFAEHRKAQALRVRILGQLLIEVGGDHRIALQRAPDVIQACTQAWGPPDGMPRVLSLRSLLGLIGAHEWRKKGVPIPALDGAHIHPHYGVFSPVRGEYVDLVAHTPLPAAVQHTPRAFDLGVGTGVLSAVLARRGVSVVATDLSPRAIVCAQDNLQRLGLQAKVDLVQTDLYPEGQAALVVCNPPWLPAQPHALLDQAIYDPDSRMLRAFLSGLATHLCVGGEGWLILSDLAEHLGLRPRAQLLQWFSEAGLQVVDRIDTRPHHGKALDPTDLLHFARAQEVTSLWRLRTAH